MFHYGYFRVGRRVWCASLFIILLKLIVKETNRLIYLNNSVRSPFGGRRCVSIGKRSNEINGLAVERYFS